MHPQTFASEPTENGKYQITRYNVIKDCRVPIKGEVYPIETMALERARELNELENIELKENYNDKVNSLNNDYVFWGIDETIKAFNELKSREGFLNDNEKQLLSDSNRKLVAWNKRVNEVVEFYNQLMGKGINGITAPYKYVLKILRD